MAPWQRPVVGVNIDIIIWVLSNLNHMFNLLHSIWIDQSISVYQILLLLQRIVTVIEIHIQPYQTLIFQHIIFQLFLLVNLWNQRIKLKVCQIPLWKHFLLFIQYPLNVQIVFSVLNHYPSSLKPLNYLFTQSLTLCN